MPRSRKLRWRYNRNIPWSRKAARKRQGRAAHPAKRGRIPADQPRILDRLGVDPEALSEQADSFLRRFGAAVGAPQFLTDAPARRQQAYLCGIRMAKRLFRGEAAA